MYFEQLLKEKYPLKFRSIYGATFSQTITLNAVSYSLVKCFCVWQMLIEFRKFCSQKIKILYFLTSLT